MLTLLLAWWRSRRLVGSPSGHPTYIVRAVARDTRATAAPRVGTVAAAARNYEVRA